MGGCECDCENCMQAMGNPAHCRFDEIDDGEAICLVVTDYWELPRVGFPVEIVTGLKLEPGDWFWWDHGDEYTKDTDKKTDTIDVDELNRLYEESKRLRDGEEWPEYTGPGE